MTVSGSSSGDNELWSHGNESFGTFLVVSVRFNSLFTGSDSSSDSSDDSIELDTGLLD